MAAKPQQPTPAPGNSSPRQSNGFEDDDNSMMDKNSVRLMVAATLGFLIFYLLIVSAKLLTESTSNKEAAQLKHLAATQSEATRISSSIENNVIWVNNGLAEGTNPAHSARLITKSPQIFASAILNGRGNIVASYPSNSGFLKNVSTKAMSDNSISITSIIETNGRVIPVIIKKSGSYFAVAALTDQALLTAPQSPTNEMSALIAASGRVISGNETMGKTGLLESFNLKASQLGRVTSVPNFSTDSQKIAGRKYQLASVKVRNTNLYMLKAKPVMGRPILKSNLTLFTILFLGTCLLVGMLLNSLYKQLRSMQKSQRQSEVSQQRFRAAVEGDKGGVWEIDLTNDAAFLSASLAVLLGLPNQEHTMPISQFLGLFHPQDRERFLATARRAHIQGEFDIAVNVAHLPLILQCRGRPSTRSGPDFTRVIVGVALDITEQKGAQARLQATEARLHNALSSMTDSFVVWDAMNRLVVWNVKFEDFFNIQHGTMQPGMEHASVDYMASPSIEETFQTGDNEGWVEMKLKDGRWIRYIETATAEGGRVSVGTEITEIRTREAQLRENETALTNTVNVLRKSQARIVELAERYEQEKIRAEEANQSKSDFLASMSHELRTPLNAINGFSDIMQKEMFGPLGDPRYKEYINDILFSGQHLLALINDILDMSKIEAGKMTLNTEVVFMHDMVSQVIRIIRGRAEDAQLNLDIRADEIREIEADPRAVKQILINLLTNAIKFTPEGGTVGVELIEKQSGIIIKVRDSGIGISQANIERLAKPFEQVEESASRQTEGTGLGLALSKSLVELHGGNFQIESVLGEGTTVIFSLPNKPIVRAEEVEEDNVSQEISLLAKDIANVLGDEIESEQVVQEPVPTQQTPATPYAYEQPQNPYEAQTQESQTHVIAPPNSNRPAA